MSQNTCPIPECGERTTSYQTQEREPVWFTCEGCGKFVVQATEDPPALFSRLPVKLSELRGFIKEYGAAHSGNSAPIGESVLRALERRSNARSGTTPPTCKVDRIGFFHFVKRHDSPIDALRRELSREREALSGGPALVVLPEAFNIGKDDNTVGMVRTDPQILEQLVNVATDFNITMVAGLIVEEDETVLPYNSGYLVTAEGFQRLCRKQMDDGNGGKHYTLSARGSDKGNGVAYDSLYMFATICRDIDLPTRREMFHAAANVLGVPSLECIPASMSAYSLASFGSSVVTEYRVLANSHPKGIGSTIVAPGRKPVSETGSENRIKVALLNP